MVHSQFELHESIIDMTTRFAPFTLLAILVSFSPLIATAQVTSGELVRVRTASGTKVIGMVSEVTDGSLGLTFPGGGSQSISFGDMESLHRSIGSRTYRKRSALIGAGAGVLTGVAAGIAVGDFFGGSLGLLAGVYYSAVFGAGGSLVGVIVGSFVKGERWQVVCDGFCHRFLSSMSIEPRIGIRANGNPILGVQVVF